LDRSGIAHRSAQRRVLPSGAIVASALAILRAIGGSKDFSRQK